MIRALLHSVVLSLLTFVTMDTVCSCRPARSDRALHTFLVVDTRSAFLSYQHASDQPSDVTICIKDIKGLLMMCEQMGADVSIRCVGRDHGDQVSCMPSSADEVHPVLCMRACQCVMLCLYCPGVGSVDWHAAAASCP